MEQTVYLDVLLAVNFVVDYLLLAAVSRLARYPTVKGGHMLLGALAGSLSSLVLFLPPLPLLFSAGYQLLIAAVMAALTFGWHGGKILLRDTFFLFTASYLYGGLMLALWQRMPQTMLCYNGVVYFNISTAVLICTTSAAYGAIWLFDQFFRRTSSLGRRCQVELTIADRSVLLTALVDSGNTVREPFSGSPVAVCALDAVEHLLPTGFAQAARTGQLAVCSTLAQGMQPRMIPCRTVAGKQALPALRPTRLLLLDPQGKDEEIQDVYVAISTGPIGGGDYQLLLSPEMIGPINSIRR